MSYKEQAESLYGMIGQGEILNAFEKYYHEDVVMTEPNGGARVGKATNREYEQNFVESIGEMHGGGVHNITANEDDGVTMVESWMDVTFKNGNRMKWEQVARQTWEGDQIKDERFYYNMPG